MEFMETEDLVLVAAGLHVVQKYLELQESLASLRRTQEQVQMCFFVIAFTNFFTGM